MSTCPACRHEAEDGAAICPVCGAALEENISIDPKDTGWHLSANQDGPAWPLDAQGQPVPPRQLVRAGDGTSYTMTLSMMAAYGIPTVTKMPYGAFSSPVIFGGAILGGYIFVPETLWEDAKALLDAGPLEDDFEEEDTIDE